MFSELSSQLDKAEDGLLAGGEEKTNDFVVWPRLYPVGFRRCVLLWYGPMDKGVALWDGCWRSPGRCTNYSVLGWLKVKVRGAIPEGGVLRGRIGWALESGRCCIRLPFPVERFVNP